MDKERLLLEARRRLERVGFKTSSLNYRPVGRRKALDLIAVKGKELLIIKGSENTTTIMENETRELKAISRVFNGKSLIVSRKFHSRALEDYILYERHKIPTVTPKGLEMLVSGELYVYSNRGGYFVNINGRVLRKAREERGLSLGDLACILGVSRKAIYEYERGSISASINVALKLIEIFGEEVIEPLSLERLDEERKHESLLVKTSIPDINVEEKLMKKLRRLGLVSIHTRTTPVDIIAKDPSEGKTLIFTVDHGADDHLESKINAAVKMSRAIGLKVTALVSKSRLKSLEIPEDCLQLTYDEVEKLTEKDLL